MVESGLAGSSPKKVKKVKRKRKSSRDRSDATISTNTASVFGDSQNTGNASLVEDSSLLGLMTNSMVAVENASAFDVNGINNNKVPKKTKRSRLPPRPRVSQLSYSQFEAHDTIHEGDENDENGDNGSSKQSVGLSFQGNEQKSALDLLSEKSTSQTSPAYSFVSRTGWFVR